MAAALAVTRVIDELNRRIGIIAIYLVLFASLVSAFNAMFRYSDERPALARAHISAAASSARIVRILRQQLQHAVGSSVVHVRRHGDARRRLDLKVNEHVRVDLVYGSVSERTRTWIDLLGGIFFLLPMCALMLYFTWPWFWQSWITNEGSLNAGGLVAGRSSLCVPVGFALVGLQGISEIIKCVLALTHGYVREFAYEKPLQ